MKITVLGGGTWGTALAILLANKGYEVTVWSKIKKELDEMEADRSMIKNLPGAVLPESVILEPDEKTALKDRDVIVFAVASPYVRATAKYLAPFIRDGQIIVNVAKGVEESSLCTLTEVIAQEIGNADIAVLSGPSHAEEVSRLIPTTVVVGAKTRETAEFLQDVFMTEYFRVYTSPDIIGIELGGSLKNVIALAAGMVDGVGYGDNTKAALMTRGMAEIGRLGLKMGGKLETFAGLSGIGDLFVTCSSLHSRNRNAGYLMGQGKTMQEAMDEVSQIVEGVYSAKAGLALAKKYGVEMPITEQVNHILFDGKSVRAAFNELLVRDKKPESGSLTWNE